MQSPYALGNDALYRRWRAWKLENYPVRTESVVVEVRDPRNPSSTETQELLRVCRKANMAIYRSRLGDEADSAAVPATAPGVALPPASLPSPDAALPLPSRDGVMPREGMDGPERPPSLSRRTFPGDSERILDSITSTATCSRTRTVLPRSRRCRASPGGATFRTRTVACCGTPTAITTRRPAASARFCCTVCSGGGGGRKCAARPRSCLYPAARRQSRLRARVDGARCHDDTAQHRGRRRAPGQRRPGIQR